jgi:hypothetical protein
MAVVPDGAPEGVTTTEITSAGERGHSLDEKKQHFNEKTADIEVNSERADSEYEDDAAKIYVPDENEEFIDPRLKDYPIPLVAKTVDLHNDFSYVPSPRPSAHASRGRVLT